MRKIVCFALAIGMVLAATLSYAETAIVAAQSAVSSEPFNKSMIENNPGYSYDEFERSWLYGCTFEKDDGNSSMNIMVISSGETSTSVQSIFIVFAAFNRSEIV